MTHIDMPKLGDTLSFSEAIRKFNELEYELLSNVLVPDYMNKVKMCEFTGNCAKLSRSMALRSPRCSTTFVNSCMSLPPKGPHLPTDATEIGFISSSRTAMSPTTTAPTSSLFDSTASCCKSNSTDFFDTR